MARTSDGGDGAGINSDREQMMRPGVVPCLLVHGSPRVPLLQMDCCSPLPSHLAIAGSHAVWHHRRSHQPGDSLARPAAMHTSIQIMHGANTKVDKIGNMMHAQLASIHCVRQYWLHTWLSRLHKRESPAQNIASHSRFTLVGTGTPVRLEYSTCRRASPTSSCVMRCDISRCLSRLACARCSRARLHCRLSLSTSSLT